VRGKFSSIAAVALLALFVGFYSWQVWIAAIQPEQDRHAHGSYRHAEEVIRSELPDERIADWTKVLAVFTGLLVGVSIFQGFYLIRADKTARLNASAASLLANAATEQVALAKKTAEIPLRAYLSIGAIDADRRTGLVRAQILNKGKTPANKVTIKYRSEWVESDTHFPGHYEEKELGAQIAPDDKEFNFIVYDLDMRDSAANLIYIYSGILYTDWFSNKHTCTLSFVVDLDSRIVDRRYETD
jgi:hypothetical protein